MMKPKERWLAALRLQPVDRLPFWPKLDGAYPKAQESPFDKMDADAIHHWVGSDRHVGIPGCVKEVRKTTSVEAKSADGLRRTTFNTRFGSLHSASRYDAASNSWHPVEFPVKSREDIKRMTEFYADCQFELDRGQLEQSKARSKEIGQDAVTADSIGTSALMHWVQLLAGVENAHYLLADHPEEVEALFAAIHRTLLRKTEIIAENGVADLSYLVENTSTTLISPEQYRTYCRPYILQYAQIMKSGGKLLALHMCGHLKALLPDLSELPLAAFEAFTSPPVGNTTFLDGRTGCPDKCLIGGTNAVLWTKSADEIIAQIERGLDALPHHRGIVVTSAGVMPPRCDPETIRAVGDWVKSYRNMRC
jgi:uroporphyrinogen-III decarboxylase